MEEEIPVMDGTKGMVRCQECWWVVCLFVCDVMSDVMSDVM